MVVLLLGPLSCNSVGNVRRPMQSLNIVSPISLSIVVVWTALSELTDAQESEQRAPNCLPNTSLNSIALFLDIVNSPWDSCCSGQSSIERPRIDLSRGVLNQDRASGDREVVLQPSIFAITER
jgi:hypothetical protein